MPTHALPETKSATPPAAATPCPKCGKVLVDPNGLGWCSACGYCKSLADVSMEPAVVEAEAETTPPTPSMGAATVGAIGHLPVWFWVLLVVIAQGVGLSIVAGHELPEGANLSRAAWCTGQIGAGLLLMFFAQCWLLLQIAPEVATLSFKDAVMPFKLWPLAMKRLPKNQLSLWAASFGATILIGAFVWVGGLEHWLTYLPAAKGAAPAAVATPAPSGSSWFSSPAPSSPVNAGAVVPVD
ncbi:MAG TPA: hypothetical protein VHR72_08070 [Gemmataceae bacterium]|jgi:hypothetical protein|nr:hypothetical protein [Gemmataceae bacterium]